jgi:pimeloyl-ACP methyl ester carboxylesterase
VAGRQQARRSAGANLDSQWEYTERCVCPGLRRACRITGGLVIGSVACPQREHASQRISQRLGSGKVLGVRSRASRDHPVASQPRGQVVRADQCFASAVLDTAQAETPFVGRVQEVMDHLQPVRDRAACLFRGHDTSVQIYRLQKWQHRIYGYLVLYSVSVEPFTIAVGDDVLDDLRQRIRRTRWPAAAPVQGWDYGADTGYLRDVLATWAGSFDWRAQERALNRFAHFRACVSGVRVHFVHVRGKGPDPLPIVLTHGWPSTFTEHLGLAQLLADPAANGGRAEDAFHVVVASLPGYGFSDPPPRPGMTSSDVADMWCRLMREGLGYARFGAHGSDIGAGVTTRLGWRHPDALLGIHLSAVGFPSPPPPWTPAEREYEAAVQRWDHREGAYSEVQSTKPQTLACGLNDSPAGLAAWIIEKFRAWSDCGGDVESRFTRDQLLANLTIYWATQTIGSSVRPYYEYRHNGGPLPPDARISVPAGFAVFANEFVPVGSPPRELAERTYQVTRWTEFSRGGHFPALEEPGLLAEDIRRFFRSLRASRT